MFAYLNLLSHLLLYLLAIKNIPIYIFNKVIKYISSLLFD